MFHGSEINLEVGHAVSISISCGATGALAVRFVRSLPEFDIMSRESAIARLLIVDDDLPVRTLAAESLKAALAFAHAVRAARFISVLVDVEDFLRCGRGIGGFLRGG